MTLNQNSKVAKIYRWFYYTDVMPSNLCPYFWKLVAMWFFILPYVILTLPAHSFNKFRSIPKTEASGISAMLYCIICILACMLYSITLFLYIEPNHSFLQSVQLMGAAIWVLTIFVGLYKGGELLIKLFTKKPMTPKQSQPKEPSLVVEFVKARYNQYCPKIDWK